MTGPAVLAAAIEAVLAEDERWARAASSVISPDGTRGTHEGSGDHWQWEDVDTDQVAAPVAEGEFLNDGEDASLRSVEQYPTERVGELPHFLIGRSEEVDAAAAGHIARHDPARVLRQVEAYRRILAEHAPLAFDADSSGFLLPDAFQRPVCWCCGRVRWPCPTVEAAAHGCGIELADGDSQRSDRPVP